MLKQDDIALIEKKDYIQRPKPNGYRSLHLIVAVPIFLEHEKRIMKAEIQLRTIAMDSWASLEHQLRYKKNNRFDENMAEEIRHCAELSAELDERMNRLKNKIYAEDCNESVMIQKEMKEMQRLEKVFDYLYKDPDENLKKLLKWAEKYTGKMYKNQIDMIRDAVENPDNPFHAYIEHILDNADPEVVKTVAVNFFINENMIGYPK